MNCKLCHDRLEFVEECTYAVSRWKPKKTPVGMVFVCPTCGAEYLRRAGGKFILKFKPTFDLCMAFEHGSPDWLDEMWWGLR